MANARTPVLFARAGSAGLAGGRNVRLPMCMGLKQSQISIAVIPEQAGIHLVGVAADLDPRLRGDDEKRWG